MFKWKSFPSIEKDRFMKYDDRKKEREILSKKALFWSTLSTMAHFNKEWIGKKCAF